MFFRVISVIGVSRALKSRKLTSCFLGPYQILQRIRGVAYQIALVRIVWGGPSGGNVTWKLEEPDEGFVSESVHLR